MIKTYTGPMFSDKSASLIDEYKRLWNKDIIIAFKPKADSRDGAVIKSKKYPDIEIPATLVDTTEEIREYLVNSKYRTVLIDEAEFLTGEVRELLDLSVILDIDFYIAGLNMTSEQEPFGIMAGILAISDEIVHIQGCCQDCNKPSRYTFSLNENKTKQVEVGDNYVSLCPTCLRIRSQARNGGMKTLRRTL